MAKVTVLMAKVIDEGQSHKIEGHGRTSKSRSQLKVKVIVKV